MTIGGLVRAVVSMGFAGIGILGSAPSASAAITSVTVAAANPSVTAKCPVEVSFTGSIKGSAGTKVSYTFLRIVDNVVKSFDQGMVTMPGSGSITINDTYWVGSSTSGVTQEQVWVHNISTGSTGQADIYSTPAGFTVTCQPNPGARPNARPPITLHPQWFARRTYKYEWEGPLGDLPDRGSGPCIDLCVGWSHFHQGDSAWLRHLNLYFRSFVGYDLAALKTVRIARAILTLTVANGNEKCFEKVGLAVLHQGSLGKGTTETFEAPYPKDGDFNWSTPLVHRNAGSVAADVTSIVQAWGTGAAANEGFVLRGKVEDNGSDDNQECTVGFRPDAVLTIEELP